MANIKYNGIDFDNAKFTKNNANHHLDIIRVNGKVKWAEPYTLSYVANPNVSYVEVTRTNSYVGKVGNIAIGETLYYGDSITVKATPKSGFKITDITNNGDHSMPLFNEHYFVEQNVNIIVETEQIPSQSSSGNGGNGSGGAVEIDLHD